MNEDYLVVINFGRWIVVQGQDESFTQLEAEMKVKELFERGYYFEEHNGIKKYLPITRAMSVDVMNKTQFKAIEEMARKKHEELMKEKENEDSED